MLRTSERKFVIIFYWKLDLAYMKLRIENLRIGRDDCILTLDGNVSHVTHIIVFVPCMISVVLVMQLMFHWHTVHGHETFVSCSERRMEIQCLKKYGMFLVFFFVLEVNV
jgi:hypothetical protein